MNIVKWMFFLGCGILGGLFLMPYKVAFVTIGVGIPLILCGFIFGFIGVGLFRRFHYQRYPDLLPVSVFFIVSGILGTLVNLFGDISGFPLLAVWSAMTGMGMYSNYLYNGSTTAT